MEPLKSKIISMKQKILVVTLLINKNGKINALPTFKKTCYAELDGAGEVWFRDREWWPKEDFTYFPPEKLITAKVLPSGTNINSDLWNMLISFGYVTESQCSFGEENGVYVLFLEFSKKNKKSFIHE